MSKEEKKSNYFSESELACKCGRKECDAAPFSSKLLGIMNSIREEYGKPIIVTSARRCAEHNEKVMGKPNSKHLLGEAIDIKMTMEDLVPFLALVSDKGIRGVGIANGWLHLDIRKGRYRSWFY